MTAAVRQWNRPVAAWVPPLDGGALHAVLEKVRQWQPFDGGAVLDDVAAVLDDVPPPVEDTEDIAEQLRSHLSRLVTIATAAEADQDTTAAQLIRQARTLVSEDVPGDHRKAMGHLRRMGWAVNELLDRLVAVRCLKEVA
ncbi:DUF6415 family natural product biosynthesis protein [Streptomyces hirsutus]|uniref:DUF6415 family natural product biosynthesis protein n=1 Tax=Streptomyces hirsutus TaxID=35620 RepID=UPI00369CE412